MPIVNSLYITNLPMCVNKSILKDAITDKFKAAIVGNLDSATVKLYKYTIQTDEKKPPLEFQKAVISNIAINYRKLCYEGRVLYFGKNAYRNAPIHIDHGDERENSGLFIETKCGFERRRRNYETGFTGDYVRIFHKEFEIQYEHFIETGSDFYSVKKPPNFDPGPIHTKGGSFDYRCPAGPKKTEYHYTNPMMVIQAAHVLRGKYIYGKNSDEPRTKQPYQICDYEAVKILPEIRDSKTRGFGPNGTLVNFTALQKKFQYIPFKIDGIEVFEKKGKIIDVDYMQSLVAKCPKCHNKYTIIGFDAYQEYYAGRCENCVYRDLPTEVELDEWFKAHERQIRKKELYKKSYQCDQQLTQRLSDSEKEEIASYTKDQDIADAALIKQPPIGDPDNSNTGICWRGETITRLSPGSDSDSKKLHIIHQPIAKNHANPRAYRYEAIPLLNQNYNDTADNFAEHQLTNGTIDKYAYLGSSDGKVLIALNIAVPASNFWMNGPSSIYKMSIKVLKLTDEENSMNKTSMNMEELFTQECELFNIKPALTNNHIMILLTQIWIPGEYLTPDNKLVKGLQFDVTPMPNMTEKKILTKILWKYHATNNVTEHVKRIVLGMESENCYNLPDIMTKYNFSSTTILDNLPIPEFLRKDIEGLNEKQQEAFKYAIFCNTSVVDGPPGTGKTYVLVMIIITLCFLGMKKIIASASNNYAAENLAKAITKYCMSKDINTINVLRISSVGQILRLEKTHPGDNESDGRHFKDLHTLVKREEGYLNVESGLADIKHHVVNGTLNEVTEKKLDKFRTHTRIIEHKIMEDFEVYVVTALKLSDGLFQDRHESYIGDIDTIIIDEAAQLHQASILYALEINPKRIILCGDVKQLLPFSSSYSSDVAGFTRSVMESMLLRKSIVPKTTLEYQYRMHNDICRVVNLLIYHGKLKTHRSVDKRHDIFTVRLNEELGLQQDHKKTIFYTHEFVEQKINDSYQNFEEANGIKALVMKLRKHGIHEKDIIVLTMYRKQKELLQTLFLENRNTIGVVVQTVDSYQGRESKVIIISITRAKRDVTTGILTGGIGFVGQPNRLGVALSRAKYAEFIFGNKENLEKNSVDVIEKLLNIIKDCATVENMSKLNT